MQKRGKKKSKFRKKLNCWLSSKVLAVRLESHLVRPFVMNNKSAISLKFLFEFFPFCQSEASEDVLVSASWFIDTKPFQMCSYGSVERSVQPGAREGTGQLSVYMDRQGSTVQLHNEGQTRQIWILISTGAGIQLSSFVSMSLSFHIYKMVRIIHIIYREDKRLGMTYGNCEHSMLPM